MSILGPIFVKLIDAKKEPQSGGTTFFIEVPNDNHPILPIISNLSKIYRNYNDTFVYKVVSTIKKPKITAFTSEYCGEEFIYSGNKKKLKTFIHNHRFGVYHHYDTNEFIEIYSSKKRGVILFTENELSDAQKDGLREISKEHCDSHLFYGWANVNEDKGIVHITNIQSNDLPLLYPMGSRKQHSIYKGKISEAWDTPFMDEFRLNSYHASLLNFGLFIRANYFLLVIATISSAGLYLILYGIYELARQSLSKTE